LEIPKPTTKEQTTPFLGVREAKEQQRHLGYAKRKSGRPAPEDKKLREKRHTSATLRERRVERAIKKSSGGGPSKKDNAIQRSNGGLKKADGGLASEGKLQCQKNIQLN